MESKKHYNLSTTEDNGQSITTTNTSTEHPAEILRMMQLAGMETAHMVHQEAIEEEVDSEFKPTPANDKLDLDDYSKKSPESIAKQKKSIQPTLGDNPLEYSLDENEIQEALMKEFDASEKLEEERTDEIAPLLPVLGMAARALGGAALRNPIKTAVGASLLTGGGDDEEKQVNASKKKKGEKLNAVKEETEETEEVTEAQSPAQKAAFAKMLAAKNPKKEETEESVEETEETEKTVEENLEKAQEQINELKEDCSCGHGSDCDCGPECDCGCNSINEEVTIQDAVNESQERLRKLMNY
jgi:hypothetical protein